MVDRTKRGKRKLQQGELAFGGRGGRRKGAGRKPKGAKAMVPHETRAALASRFPVHANFKLKEGLPSLRRVAERKVLWEAFAKACEQDGFRLVEFSIQRNHVHLICEGTNRERLARGLQGLAIRVAKALNRLWQRRGSVFADRYHDVILRTPQQVRNALVYVLQNAKRHGLRLAQGIDSWSSALWFDGWNEPLNVHGLDAAPVPVTNAGTWLLAGGWRRLGRLRFDETPTLTPT